MNKSDYNLKMLEILSDESKFGIKDKDITLYREGQLKTFLYSLKRKGVISDEVYKKVYPKGSEPARMYGNPTTHKLSRDQLGNIIPSLRPINSSMKSFNYKLAKYLSELLDPVIPTDHCTTDTFSFVEEIKEVRIEESFMVSFDVVNLFTNIPLDETIDLAIDRIFKHHKNIKMTKIQMRKLFVFATKQTHFVYNGQYYDQIDGVAMGSPLGPKLANLFMGHFEKVWLNEYGGPKVLHYRRYVDDIFCMFQKEEHVAPFLEYLNEQHPNIKFSTEKESNGCLPFLDVLIEKSTNFRFETTTFRKSTYTGLLTNFTSFISMTYKIGLIRTLINRATKINSTSEGLKKDFKFIQQTLQKNMYPQNILKRFISLNNRNENLNQTQKTEENPRIFKLPFIGRYSTQVKMKINNLIKKYCKPETKVRLVFTAKKIKEYFSLKDSISPDMTSYIVYKFCCANCGICYVGESTQQFIIRMNEHLYTDKASAIYKHLKENNDCKSTCNRESFSILDKASTEYQLRIKEAFYIQKLQPILNKQSKSISVELIF